MGKPIDFKKQIFEKENINDLMCKMCEVNVTRRQKPKKTEITIDKCLCCKEDFQKYKIYVPVNNSNNLFTFEIMVFCKPCQILKERIRKFKTKLVDLEWAEFCLENSDTESDSE